MQFLERLNRAIRANNSLLCIGLDSDASRVYEQYGLSQAAFNRRIIEATADLACAYKPNLAFYESQGIEGLRALEETLQAIPSHAITIADAKRGDIGSTAEQYTKAWLGRFGFDAITVNPYMGRDAIEPFARNPSHGVFVLCLTSNPSASELEFHGEPPLYLRVAQHVVEWNTHGNLGCVVGATRPQMLEEIRRIIGPTVPILAPGIGAQGGDLEATVRHGLGADGGGLLINASRSILFAGTGDDWPTASRKEAERLRDAINALRPP